MVDAHSQPQGYHYIMHFPAHPALEDDPHYKEFDSFHKAHRATARCWIGERVGFGDCRDAQFNPAPPPEGGGEQPGLKLHHAHIEFSLQNGVSLPALQLAPCTAGGPSYVSGRPGRPGLAGTVLGVSCRKSAAADSPETRVKEVISLRELACPGGPGWSRSPEGLPPSGLASGRRAPRAGRSILPGGY